MTGWNGVKFIKPSGVDVSSYSSDSFNTGLFDGSDNLTLHGEFTFDPLITPPIVSRGVSGGFYFDKGEVKYGFELITEGARARTIYEVLTLFREDAITNNQGILTIHDYNFVEVGDVDYTVRTGVITSLQRQGKSFTQSENQYFIEGVIVNFQEV